MLLGAVSIAGQIILMREIMILFYGNELSTGICLFSWLFWTATGSLFGTAVAKRKAVGIPALPPFLLVTSLLLPATVVACRVVKTVIGISQGEIIGIGMVTAIAGAILLPFCFCSGLLFPLLIRASLADTQADIDAPARIYLFESMGSAAFGIITSLILIRYFDALTISFFIAALAGSAALFLSLVGRRYILAVAAALIVSFFVLQPVFSVPDIGTITRRLQWKDFTVVESTNSVYGNLTVTRAGSQTTFYDSGVLSFTYPDVMNSELAVIYPLLLHPKPVRVLLVGGGISSTLSQILKHPSVAEIDYVELDPALIDLGRKHLPPEATWPLTDARVRVIHTDGRLFVKEARGTYDVIIVNMTDPVNARINRYFTREFFGEVKRILAPGGVFSISVGSSDEIISPVLASFLAGISGTLAAVFPHTAVVPGQTAFFVSSDRESRVDIDPALLISRMKDRGVVNSYVTEYYLRYQLSDERLEYIRRSIDNAKSIGINTDLSPTVYYYDMVLRSYWLSPGLKIALSSFAGSRPYLPAALLVGLSVLFGAFIVVCAKKRFPLPAVMLVPAALASGFSEIALTVVIIIAFQSFYGYVYFSLGLIVSAFMIGLAAGTALARAWAKGLRRPWRSLIIVQLLYGAYCLLLVGVLVFFSTYGSEGRPLGLNVIFWSLNMLCGMLAAFHYVSAVQALTSSGISRSSGGLVYGVNLTGAAIGALFASVVMIPIWGLVTTVLLVCAVNVCAAAVVGIGATCIRLSNDLRVR
jgi:spermidine synthase